MIKELADNMAMLNNRQAVMENILTRMETAVTGGMKIISEAMRDLAVVSSKQQENSEQHYIIHQRIDEAHNKIESLELDFNSLKTSYAICCGNPKPAPPMNPIKVAILTFISVALLAAFILLILMHANEMKSVFVK